MLSFISVLAIIEGTWLRHALPDLIAARTGRHIEVRGPLELHLLSLSPSLVAHDVTIGNPPWMPPGVLARVRRLAVEFEFPTPGTPTPIRAIELTGARLHLVRDGEGRSNWASSPPNPARRSQGRLIRSLKVPAAEVVLDDARRNLRFAGRVTASDETSATKTDGRVTRLRLEGNGTLNGKPVKFEIQGDPLATVRRDRPYRFRFQQQWGDSRLVANGALPRPFDVGQVDAEFESSGTSLRDLYRMIGVPLPESAAFTLTGKLERRHTRSTFSDLDVHFGESEMTGTVTTSTVAGRRRFDADVHAKTFRVQDVGRRAAESGQGTPTRTEGREGPLLPDTPLPFSAVRQRSGLVKIRVDKFAAGPVELHELFATARLRDGKMEVHDMRWQMGGARVTGKLDVDAASEAPSTRLDLSVAGLELGRFGAKRLQQAPFGGPLFARVRVDGRGDSLREFAASATGTVSAILPHGVMRASLAELAGPSLRGVGLALAKNSKGTEVRCAFAQFQGRDGVFQSHDLLIDTEDVVIRGQGSIDLRSESLGLTFRGQAKKIRVGRIRSPVRVQGPMRHPTFRLSSEDVAKQAGAAVLLGAIAPPAAVLAFIDPGFAEDTPCRQLIGAAEARQ